LNTFVFENLSYDDLPTIVRAVVGNHDVNLNDMDDIANSNLEVDINSTLIPTNVLMKNQCTIKKKDQVYKYQPIQLFLPHLDI